MSRRRLPSRLPTSASSPYSPISLLSYLTFLPGAASTSLQIHTLSGGGSLQHRWEQWPMPGGTEVAHHNMKHRSRSIDPWWLVARRVILSQGKPTEVSSNPVF
ncbi:hypothetical protein VPH35_002202 [Triticum aestivum]